MNALARFIVRPYRDVYANHRLRDQKFCVAKKEFVREEVVLNGSRGKIVCSWYYNPKKTKSKCIVYCHGNSGCQLDAEEVLEPGLMNRFSLLAFDFSGSGRSDGDVVSLGYYEKNDIEVVVNFLYTQVPDIKIILWGRSMGAVACILYVFCNPHITAMVLDSPYSDFSKTADKVISSYKVVPKFLRDMLYKSACEHIQKTYGFDLNDLCPRNFLNNCWIPTVFIHSNQDTLIDISNSRELYQLIKGPKCLLEITGDHNSVRNKYIVSKTLKILNLLISNSKSKAPDIMTIRNDPPELKKSTLAYLTHKRGLSSNM